MGHSILDQLRDAEHNHLDARLEGLKSNLPKTVSTKVVWKVEHLAWSTVEELEVWLNNKVSEGWELYSDCNLVTFLFRKLED